MKILFYKFQAFVVTWLLRLLPRNAPMVYKGINSAITLCEQVSVLGFDRVLIVSDEFLANSGILDGIKDTLGSTGVEFVIFDGVLPDPSFDQVEAGEAMLCDHNSQAIIAVGGGSVLDAAKMMALLHTNPGSLDSFNRPQKSKNQSLPLFAIPTTAGTGSEITLAAIITDPETHKKVPVIDSKMIPGYVALDAGIMQGLPPGITAATGMDALTHAVESYLSKASSPATEIQSRAAVRLIFKYLPRAYAEGGDLEARDGMAMASFYAGSAFGKTSVGYVHAIAHQLGRVCSTPHGNANAMVLPEVLSAYGECVHERLADLARLIGIGGASDNDAQLAGQFIQAVIDMRLALQLPLQPQGLERKDVAEIIKEALVEAGGLYPVPRYMSAGEVGHIVNGLFPA